MAYREYDICIFGASGFTGTYVAIELARANTARYRWAVAGRSRGKLEDVVDMVESKVKDAHMGIIVADVNDTKAMKEMTSRCKVLINCVGPFRYYGEQVVRACVNTGTHYVDITGEPEFIERMQSQYGKAAEENNVTIVPSCGFDSIPADIGTQFTAHQFAKNKRENPVVDQSNGEDAVGAFVESYLNVQSKLGLRIHFATYESAVQGFGSVQNLRELRKKRPRVNIPKVKGVSIPRYNVHYSERKGRYCFPFMGADAAVVRSSQEYLVKHEIEDEQPVQYAAYYATSNFVWWLLSMLFGVVFSTLAKTPKGRKILLDHPGFFSGGLVSHRGPTEAQMDRTSFEMTFFGYGFKGGESEGRSKKPDVAVVTHVAGPEPGYVATPIFVTQCAFTVIEELHGDNADGKRVRRPGVLTPAAAFRGTTLISRLRSRGITFVVDYVGPCDKRVREKGNKLSGFAKACIAGVFLVSGVAIASLYQGMWVE